MRAVGAEGRVARVPDFFDWRSAYTAEFRRGELNETAIRNNGRNAAYLGVTRRHSIPFANASTS